MTTCTCPPAYLRREGRHQEACAHHRVNLLGLTEEHRAVFSYPGSILGPTPDTYGPWRSTLAEAAKDRAPRPEETWGTRSGFQRRLVGPIEPEPVLIELDAVPLMGDDRTTEEERDQLRTLHGLWIDPATLHEAMPSDPPGRFTTQRSGQIVYREGDLAPAEVHTLRRDWNHR